MDNTNITTTNPKKRPHPATSPSSNPTAASSNTNPSNNTATSPSVNEPGAKKPRLEANEETSQVPAPIRTNAPTSPSKRNSTSNPPSATTPKSGGISDEVRQALSRKIEEKQMQQQIQQQLSSGQISVGGSDMQQVNMNTNANTMSMSEETKTAGVKRKQPSQQQDSVTASPISSEAVGSASVSGASTPSGAMTPVTTAMNNDHSHVPTTKPTGESATNNNNAIFGRKNPDPDNKTTWEKIKESAELPKNHAALVKEMRKKGAVPVVNDSRLCHIPAGLKEKFLGSVLYTGPRVLDPTSMSEDAIQLFVLPTFTTADHFCKFQVRIPAEFLTHANPAVMRDCVWGTDIYTDDSDIVSMLIHSGYYKPVDAPEGAWKVEESQTNESTEGNENEVKVEKDSETKEQDKSRIISLSPPTIPFVTATASSDLDTTPSQDAIVTLRVLPKLARYGSSKRNGLKSRGWGTGHEGESLVIETVQLAPRGTVIRQGANWGKGCSRKSGRPVRSVSNVVLRPVANIDPAVGAFGKLQRPATPSSNVSGMVVEDACGVDGVIMCFSDVGGELCYKYSETIMKAWPLYLYEQTVDLSATERRFGLTNHSSAAFAALHTDVMSRTDATEQVHIPFSRRELIQYQSWPYWRLKLMKQVVWLDGISSERYQLSRNETSDTESESESYSLKLFQREFNDYTNLLYPDCKTANIFTMTLFDDLSPHDILFDRRGLVIKVSMKRRRELVTAFAQSNDNYLASHNVSGNNILKILFRSCESVKEVQEGVSVSVERFLWK